MAIVPSVLFDTPINHFVMLAKVLKEESFVIIVNQY